MATDNRSLTKEEWQRRHDRYFWDTRRTTDNPETEAYGWDDERMFLDLEAAEVKLNSCQTATQALRALLEAVGEDALERHAADGLMLAEDDPAWCRFCGAEFHNQRDSRDISLPDDYRGDHLPDCVFVAALSALDDLDAV
jgi:hypothetical protein